MSETAQASFDIEPAPRSVPASTRRRLLYGRPTAQVGWAFLAAGMIFFWVFGWRCEFWTMLQFSRSTAYAHGAVTGVEDTGSSENEERIFRISYRFDVDGTSYTGASYGFHNQFAGSEPVSIEYVTGSPSVSRIDGMRREPFSAWAMLVTIFPGLGLLFAFLGLRAGRRDMRVLVHGRPTLGILREKEPTGTSVNEVPEYQLRFSYIDEHGDQRAGDIRTFRPDRVEDEPEERLLYDPRQTRHIVLIDALPGKVHLDHRGRLAASGSSAKYMIAPAAAALVCGLFLVLGVF